MADMKNISDEQWKEKLTSEEYRVTRMGYTEPPWSGKYLNNDEKGVYKCISCGEELFSSDTKYKSTTPGLEGWPSFYDVLSGGKVELKDDFSFGMHRTEVVCANCGAHLGHVFDDEYDPQLKDKGGKHYCINSCALNFKPQEK